MEQVLVIKNDDLSSFISSTDLYKFIEGTESEELYRIAISKNMFLLREYAETDFSSRQLIPYAILRHENSIYVLERKAKQSEQRLHNKLSIGIGGHINPIDLQGQSDIISNCLERETNEEVKIESSYSSKFIGVILDNTTEVSKVHIGIAFEILLSNTEVEVVETEKMSGEWVDLQEISKFYDRLETWSQIALNHYIKSNVLPSIASPF